jgi:hypothetical protein
VTLTAALVAMGMATSKALTAVFAYRLINFWLILLGGGIAMAVLARAREHRIRRYSRPEQEQSPASGSDARSRPEAEDRAGRPRIS